MSTAKKLSDINFFICSTYLDLKNYRDEVIKKIMSESGVINAQEFFGARNTKPIETCLEEVDKSDVFIMFVGWRYGSIDEKTGKSFIELEYEKATAKGIPRFVFFMDENHPFPPSFVAKDKEAEKLETFKKVLLTEHTIDKFTSPDDLANKVIQSLIKELPKHEFKIGKLKNKKVEEDTIQMIQKFLALPKLYYDNQITFNAKLKEFTRASENDCDAFGYRFGAALSRTFEPTDEKVKDALRSIRHVFAENDDASELLSIPKDKEISLTVRTIQGTYKWEEPIYEIKQVDPPDPFSMTAITSASFYGSTPRNEKVKTGSERFSELKCSLEFISAEY